MAVVWAMFYGDVAAQIRYFTIIGQGFVEMGQAKEGLQYLDRAPIRSPSTAKPQTRP